MTISKANLNKSLAYVRNHLSRDGGRNGKFLNPLH